MHIIVKVLAFFFLASCATTIKNFDMYEKAPILNTEFMPSKSDFEKKVPSVVIFDFTTSDQNAIKINANKFVEDYISELLIKNKMAEVQDRKNLKKLQDEIKLSELYGSKKSEIKAVDYAIDGSITNLTFDSEFIGPSYNTEGDLVRRAGYEYTSTIQGFIKIYEVPSLKVVDTISFSGSAYKYEEAAGMKIWKIRTIDPAKSFDQELIKEATRSAMARNNYKIKSFFAKSGFILEKRTLKDKTIFLISIGYEDGIRQDDRIDIYQRYSTLNPITGEEAVSTKLIATGKVADKTEEKFTWIVVDGKKASTIKLGDIAKVNYLK